MMNELLKMNDDCKESLNNMYGFKDVPDIFCVNKDTNEIFHCIDTLNNFYTSLKEDGKWYLTVASRLFTDNLLHLLENPNQKFDIYSRSLKRSRENGKDYDFCLRFNSASIFNMSFLADAAGEPSNFPITFVCDSMELIDTKECPIVKLNDEGEKVVSFPES